MRAPPARIAVIVVSKGRSDCLRSLVPFLNAQTLPPALVLFVVTEPADAEFDLAAILAPGIEGRILTSPAGTCPQRNAGLDAVGQGIDHVVFFDDDYFPSRTALAGIAAGFAHHADVDGMTGHLIADGIGGPGIPQDDAVAMLDRWDAQNPFDPNRKPVLLRDTEGLYGCNMACRVRAIDGVRFDERLPAYGWQEDVDFAAQLPGRRVETDAFAGVHLGIKSGRSSGAKLGYSQIVNPYYLWRKGTMRARFALRLAARNLLANHVRALRPEPWVDRTGRVRGNWAGLRDIVIGRADPARVLDR